jgi:quercetin dioxygenase-like cupin family protein
MIADAHAGRVVACRLQTGVDVADPRSELLRAGPNVEWTRILEAPRAEWFAVSLRSADGDYRTVAHTSGEVMDTDISVEFPAAMKLASAIPGESRRVRFALLKPGAQIPEHTDVSSDNRIDEVRLQIPIVTAPGSFLDIGGKSIHMEPGELWFVDVSQPHSARNISSVSRIHLLIDKRLNTEERQWLDRTMATAHTTSLVRSEMAT